jgi:hypothetical protein
VCSLGLNMVKDDFFSVIKEIPAQAENSSGINTF